MNNYEDFRTYMSRLEDHYNKNPKLTYNEVKKIVKELNYRETMSQQEKDHEMHKKMFVALSIIIALVGLINYELYFFYLFGLIFFLAGFFVGEYAPFVGIIFLFSHGLTGLGLMLWGIIEPILESPLMSDNPQNILLYMGLCVSIFVVAFISTILYNVSKKIQCIRHFEIIPFTLFTIGIIMVNILPKIVDILYNL